MSECNTRTPTKAQVQALLKAALDMLYKHDRYLIDNSPYRVERNGSHHVGERSIVFRLAHYMQNIMDKDEIFQNYVLDCEYNRNGIHTKTLPSFPNGVYPDVIIHNRGNNINNLLIMEVKTYWNRDNDQDLCKIREFIEGSGEYCFSFGVSLIIEKHKKNIQMNFMDGNGLHHTEQAKTL